jgi:hypothetical protein
MTLLKSLGGPVQKNGKGAGKGGAAGKRDTQPAASQPDLDKDMDSCKCLKSSDNNALAAF